MSPGSLANGVQRKPVIVGHAVRAARASDLDQSHQFGQLPPKAALRRRFGESLMSAMWTFLTCLLVIAGVWRHSALASDAKSAATVFEKSDAAENHERKGKFTLSKETTFFKGPLDKFGYVDYAAALNDHLRNGVTPEDNASVFLWKAIGPRLGGSTPLPRLFEWLKMPQPPVKGDYFIGLRTFVSENLKINNIDESEKIEKQLQVAVRRPWTAKDFPHLADWLKANERPLAVVHEATRRTGYYSPIVFSSEKQRLSLISHFLPGVQSCRKISEALACRAMLAVRDRPDEAWRDLIVCHRLGRLVGRGSSIIEYLVGKAVDDAAARADLAYLERPKLTRKQLESCLNDLQELQPFDISRQLDTFERCTALEAAMQIDLEGFEALDKMKAPAGAYRMFAEMDWDPILRDVNKWYDRLVAALREKDRTTREKKLDEIESDLAKLAKAFADAKRANEPADGKRLAKSREHALIGNLVPVLIGAFRGVQKSLDEHSQRHDLLLVAFALSLYHHEHGRYPKELSNLTPRYLQRIPVDRYSGKALFYRPAEAGYRLYSVGINGRDDDGRGKKDELLGDDVGIVFPPESLPN